ncbi:MAG TPA: flagellar biosynthesis anti-sigma factor FlgM [bacterium]|nr:flagellar biosynthesis anti-sigma factor FlgM [bacterium]
MTTPGTIPPLKPLIEPKTPVAPEKAKGTSRKNPEKTHVGQGEKVQLSPEARNLSEVHAEDPIAAAKRSRHIAQIKKQVEQGTYQVRGQEIAEKLLRTMLKERDTLK